MRKMLAFLTLFSFFLFAGCNTWSGLGQDVQKMGKKMEDLGQRKNN
jgi:predicted small secreted protein